MKETIESTALLLGYINYLYFNHISLKICKGNQNIPWPLLPLVCKRDINHSHQGFLNKGSITLTVVLFHNLGATIRSDR